MTSARKSEMTRYVYMYVCIFFFLQPSPSENHNHSVPSDSGSRQSLGVDNKGLADSCFDINRGLDYSSDTELSQEQPILTVSIRYIFIFIMTSQMNQWKNRI